ncbi:hypothetical protein Ataiwa_09340 [Algoriphagus taiwanensis]|uniref:Uncharacterized protein n=1 Tax=Algoriphagus taiwanensis TaxID=1445656 RepID=A0ABQ6Q0W0_9BACT|nr:hypothetical protein Ataiwa_09340 [Algoriphagus taiwanensis]
MWPSTLILGWGGGFDWGNFQARLYREGKETCISWLEKSIFHQQSTDSIRCVFETERVS